jgi:hypothetical protein
VNGAATAQLLASQLMQELDRQFGEYPLSYEAPALYKADIKCWRRWNEMLVRQLRAAQQPDGSIRGRFNPPIATSLSLLSLALNYRFLPIYER